MVKEFFFDDDTLTDNLPRVEALAKELGKLVSPGRGKRESQCSAQDLEILRTTGLRLFLVRL